MISEYHLLWTGGWDSTFRLVQLLGEGQTVQPHYLISPDRPSTGAELTAQSAIRAYLSKNHPALSENLLPTRYGIVTELERVPEISAAYERLRKRLFLGYQYEWLGWYCAATGIERFDAGYHNSGGNLYNLLEPLLIPLDGMQKGQVIDPRYADRDEYRLFRFYLFSIRDITKVQMQEISQRDGYFEAMKLTWFCHYPLADMTPCGRCNPCSFAIQEGMGWRLPVRSRLRYYLPGRTMLRRFVLNHQGLYTRLEHFRRGHKPA